MYVTVLNSHLHIYTRWLYIYMYVYRTQYLWKVRTTDELHMHVLNWSLTSTVLCFCTQDLNHQFVHAPIIKFTLQEICKLQADIVR